MRHISTIIVVTILTVATSLSCKQNGQTRPEKATSTVNVLTDTVRLTPIVIPVKASGLLSTQTEVKLSFKTGGVIGSFPVREGQSVKKGSLIASLDLSEINSVVHQYELALAKAGRDLQRLENLYADTVATLEMLQNGRTARDVAQSMLNISLFNRSKSVIRAPADGMVLKKLAEEGEITGSGYPVVLFAPSDGVWVVSSGLSDKDIVKVATGDSATITIDAFPGTSFPGTVYETGSFADPYTGTFTVKTAIAEPDPRFRTGMTGRISIIPAHTGESVSVPLNAITDAGEGVAYIYLVRGNSYSKVRVVTGEIAGDRIIVKEGLTAGDVYISEGMAYLTPGCTLNIINR